MKLFTDIFVAFVSRLLLAGSHETARIFPKIDRRAKRSVTISVFFLRLPLQYRCLLYIVHENKICAVLRIGDRNNAL